MITENLSTLKIHKLTQEQYERELEAGTLDSTALYLTPDEVLPISSGGTGATDAESALTNLGAVNKAGDTMTGTLTAPHLIVNSTNATPAVAFKPNDVESNRASVAYDGSTNYRFYFTQYHPDQDGAATRYYDGYALPAATESKTANNWYSILTSKNAVTMAQGGTGASNGATGLKNLFSAGNTILSSYQYGDTLPDAGTAGRIFFKKVSS